MTNAIEIKDLRKTFDGKEFILKGINLVIPKGSLTAIIGFSGTGKSVILKHILGIHKPTSGQIFVLGQDLSDMDDHELTVFRRKFGVLFQGAALFDSMKVWENVAFGLIQGQGMNPKQARDIAMDKLAQVGLRPEVGELLPAELSGGMQNRVGLARAIASNPEIIFFDEPTTGLDPIMADVINDLIVKCVRELGATALSITHDMVSARKISDRIAMLWDGRIIWDGATKQIDKSGNAYVDQFIHGRAEGPIQMQVRAL